MKSVVFQFAGYMCLIIVICGHYKPTTEVLLSRFLTILCRAGQRQKSEIFYGVQLLRITVVREAYYFMPVDNTTILSAERVVE